MTHAADALAALDAAFRSLGLRWYVFGAQAAIVHGAARVTKDVDVTVDPGAHAPAAVLDTLLAAGFASRASDARTLAETSRILPLVHRASGMPVDVALAGQGLEEAFLDNAREATIAGVRVPVAAPEDIVTMKLLAARPTDREDVVAILRAQRARFDERRVRTMLAELEAALDQSDLLPALDDALRRAR